MVLFTVKRPFLSYITLAITLACHMLAYYFYRVKYDQGPSFTPEDVEVLAIIVLLTAGALLSFGTYLRGLVRFILVVRLVLYLLLCYRYSFWFDFRLVLLVALVYETGIYEPYPINLIESGALIFISVTVLEIVGMFRVGTLPTIIARMLFMTFGSVLVAVSASFITRYRELLLDRNTENDRLNEAVTQLSRSNLMLQETAFRAAEQSKTSERHRVTREIHDTVGYSMTNLIMMMEAATDLVFDDPDELQKLMRAAREQASTGLEETRRSLRELRAYEEQHDTGLVAIDKLVSTYDSVTSVEVEIEYGNAPMSFGEEFDSALFHFVQEGLTNALRHGRAKHIWIRFWTTDGVLYVVVRDDGRGSSDLSEGMGISGMRERADRYGGMVKAHNVEDGFQIILCVPMECIQRGRNDEKDTRFTG